MIVRRSYTSSSTHQSMPRSSDQPENRHILRKSSKWSFFLPSCSRLTIPRPDTIIRMPITIFILSKVTITITSKARAVVSAYRLLVDISHLRVCHSTAVTETAVSRKGPACMAADRVIGSDHFLPAHGELCVIALDCIRRGLVGRDHDQCIVHTAAKCV
jgi:hypothetical protein